MKRSWVVFLLLAVVLVAALNTGRGLYYHLTYHPSRPGRKVDSLWSAPRDGPGRRGDRQLTKLLETLAVIKAKGRIPIGDVVAVETSHFSHDTTAVVVTPSTDERLADILRSLGRRGIRAIVVLIEAGTFGPAESSLTLLAELIASDIPAYLVKCGQPL